MGENNMSDEQRRYIRPEDLNSEISRTERQIEEKAQLIQKYAGQIKTLKKELKFLLDVRERFFPTQDRQKTRFAKSTAAEAAESVLREEGRAMHVDEIGKRLREGGYPRTEDPKKLYMSLTTTLTRSDKFAKVKPATFDLRERHKAEGKAESTGVGQTSPDTEQRLLP